MSYFDDAQAEDQHPGWGGSGESCSRCGTTEYFDNDIDGEPICDDCLDRRRLEIYKIKRDFL